MTRSGGRRATIAVLALLAFWGVAPGTGPWLRSVGASAVQLYRHRNAPRESRAASLLGDAWLLVDRAARETPPTARLLIPEGRAFDPVSNKSWCAYYLHPRRLLYPGEVSGEVSGALADAADYLLAYRGSAAGLAGIPAGAFGPTGTGLLPLAALRDAGRTDAPPDSAGGAP